MKETVFRNSFMDLIKCEDDTYQLRWNGGLVFMIDKKVLVDMALAILKKESEA